MSGVASKNLYDLLGNDPDQDPELRSDPPPVVPVDKPTARKGKRDAPAEAPVAPAATAAPADGTRGRGRGRGGRGGGRGGRRGDGYSANDEAFHDPSAGRARNLDKATEDGFQDRRGGRGRGRGGYEGRGGGERLGRGGGGSYPRNRDDRHSRTIHSGPDDQAKQAAKGWGDETGVGEWNDEKAGEAIAEEEGKEGFDSVVDKPVNAEGEHPITEEEQAEPEPEDKTKSYADYLAEQAQKKLQLGGGLEARKANEGAAKSLPEGKAIEREGEEQYFPGTGGKARRERERKERNNIVLDHDIQAREQPAARGGRGGRGGRGRGEGGRGRGFGGRGRGEGRGEFRGGRGGRGYSGAPPSGASPNVVNAADFPSLGS